MAKPYTKCTLTLDACETMTLEQLALNHRHQDIRRRGAGLLRLAQGEKPSQIAERLMVTPQVVYNWVHRWRERGIVGLLGGHAGGRPPSLPTPWLDTADAIARREALSLAGIAKAVEAAHHASLPCSLGTLRNGLIARGLSCKRTRFSLKKNAPKRNSLRNNAH
jgi:transposase